MLQHAANSLRYAQIVVVVECKLYRSETQFRAIDEGIRVGQFVSNKALRHWMDEGKAGNTVGKHDLNKLCAVLAAEPDKPQECHSALL